MYMRDGRAETLAQLAWDRSAVTDVLYNYAEALDKRDAESLKPLLAENVEAEFSGPDSGAEQGPVQSRDTLMETLLRGNDALRSVRIVNNVRVHLQGKLARATAYVTEKYFSVEEGEGKKPHVALHRRYEAECHLDRAIWRIRRLRVEHMATRGDASLLTAEQG